MAKSLMMKRIYLDNHNAARPSASSLEKLMYGYTEKWGDPSALHESGQSLSSCYKESVESLYETFGVGSHELFAFAGSLSASVRELFFSVYTHFVRETGRNHFLMMDGEKPAIPGAAGQMQQLGCATKLLPVNQQGQLTRAILEEHLRPRSAMVSLSWANGLTGVVQPVFDLAELCKEKEVLFHVDFSEAIGKLFFRLQDFPFDFATFDGAFIHAPQGTGGLFIKKETPLSKTAQPVDQIPIPALMALANAAEEITAHFDHLCTETARLRDKLEKGVQEMYSDAQVLFSEAERLPSCTAIAFPGIYNEMLLYHLQRKGIYASLGGGRLPKLSTLLLAANVEEYLAQSTLSFSLSHETTEAEIDDVLDVLSSVLKTCQGISAQIPRGCK